MTKEQLAALLNGRQRGEEISRDERRQAKADGLVVVFGFSDDNMELQGAIDDEISCYDGGSVGLLNGEVLSNDCDNEDCPHFKKLCKSPGVKKIKAVWGAGEYSWQYLTNFERAEFDVMDGDDRFCRGIVFELAAIK
ncbi:MAG: hypothetical protein WCI51_13380 [Lentisphaerota bacterium]